MVLQCRSVLIGPILQDGRHLEENPQVAVLAFRQDMMNQTKVYAAIAILERVNVAIAKGCCRRLQDGMEPVIPLRLPPDLLGTIHKLIVSNRCNWWPGTDKIAWRPFSHIHVRHGTCTYLYIANLDVA